MDLKTFFEHFDTLAEAPNGIQRLRELILDMAVRGKLVPQDPEDEPASLLFKRVQQEFKDLVDKKKLGKVKELAPLKSEEIFYTCPSGWQTCRLGEIIRVSSGVNLTSKKMNDLGKVPVFGGNGITGYHDEANVNEPTLVIGRVGYYCGSVHVTPPSAWVTDNAFITYFSKANFYIYYLYWLLRAIDLQQNNSATAQPVISGGKIYSIPIAIPPLAEQKRIVAKVDELMALCDALEAAQQTRNTLRQKLRASALDGLMNAPSNTDLETAWAFVRDNWGLMCDRPEDVEGLRQVVFRLAIQGRLTFQSNEDDSVLKILDKIKSERQLLEKEKKIRRVKLASSVSEEEKFFELPQGWRWCRLADLVFVLGDGLHGTPQYANDSEYYFINGNNLSNGKIVVKQNTKKVSLEEYQKHQRPLNENTVLVSINGTLGNIAFFNGEPIILGKSACYFNLAGNISKQYIKIVIESSYFLNYAQHNSTGTTIKNLSLKAMNLFPVPLPPLAEQKRIVAKVDELMKLCDQLEASLRQQHQRAAALAASAINHLAA